MRKVLKYLKPYRTAAILTVFLVLLHSLSQLILPSMMADIINEGITRGELSYIWRVGTIMLAISAVGVLVSILASACSSKASTGFGRELRRAVFYKVESHLKVILIRSARRRSSRAPPTIFVRFRIWCSWCCAT